MKQDRFLYMMAEQKVAHFTKIGLKVVAFMDLFFLLPLVRVAYHCCLGQYSLDSWINLTNLR